MKSIKAMKALAKAKNWHIGRMLMVLAAILAQSALAVTYTGSLPLEPACFSIPSPSIMSWGI